MPNRTTLHPRLSAALRAVEVDRERRTARVDGALVQADSPSALRHALADKLYEVWHAGLDWGEGPRPRTLRSADFEKLLAAGVPHRETVLQLPAAAVSPAPRPEQRIVLIDQVRTAVAATALTPGAAAAGPGPADRDTVELRYPAVRPALSAGFFLVDGSAGGPAADQLVRCYLHVERAEAAPALWARMLRWLEERGVRYRAKVSSSPMLYPRRDAIVVYLDEADADHAGLTAATAGLPGLGPSASVFVRELAPGVGLAAEPADPRPRMNRMSFGQHRSYAVAEGILEHARPSSSGGGPGGASSGASDIETAVCRALVRARVRPDAPWQNLSATDRLPAATGAAHEGANQ